MKILLPIDRSTYSQEAVRTVASQVSPERNEVRVIHVIEHNAAFLSADMFPHFVEDTAQVERDRLAEAKLLVNHAVGVLRHHGIRAKGEVEAGEAIKVILNYARNWNADLIVMGSHGLTGLKRVLMGSVSAAIFRDAKCSVQVVRIRNKKAGRRRKPGKN